jgi:prefoldin subunit 5
MLEGVNMMKEINQQIKELQTKVARLESEIVSLKDTVNNLYKDKANKSSINRLSISHRQSLDVIADKLGIERWKI